ncbi:Calcyphosin [Hondaea fermentalgiana]|uniref:Calcyphosin n=1 Tax=Hondaea fermentalgiana TaxID=2315210 RepID=A0A2R5G0S9_9STRA|nr:Calcyphosin [Hondaea fermentalgiana]|eukprot:GBG24610.1 Calcyphosin [Hondaea fermentalgiana]
MGGGAEVDLLEGAIRAHVETRSGFGNHARKVRIVENVFREFDVDGTGNIDEEEFLAALVRMNIVGYTETALELFDKIDADMSGTISYREFARALFVEDEAEESKGCGVGGSGFASSSRAAQAANDVVARVRQRVLQLAGKNAGIRSITRILRQMDEDGSNSLNAQELKEGLLGYGVQVSPSEVRTLMQHFDRDGSGRITIEEFLRGLRGDMNRLRRKLVRKAWDQLVTHLRLDGPGDSVSLSDLATFYDVSKHPEVMQGRMTPEEALRQFMAVWDKNSDDLVEWKEFLDYYKDLSAGIERDDYFELLIRNAWHLSGGSGWSENTANMRVLVTMITGDQQVVEIVNDFGISRSTVTKPELIRLLETQGFRAADISDVALSS